MPSDGNSGQGERDHGASERVVETLLLTYDRATDHREVDGKCNSLDLMLDMLGRATRVLESKWRIQHSRELVAELLRDAQNEAIAASLRKGA